MENLTTFGLLSKAFSITFRRFPRALILALPAIFFIYVVQIFYFLQANVDLLEATHSFETRYVAVSDISFVVLGLLVSPFLVRWLRQVMINPKALRNESILGFGKKEIYAILQAIIITSLFIIIYFFYYYFIIPNMLSLYRGISYTIGLAPYASFNAFMMTMLLFMSHVFVFIFLYNYIYFRLSLVFPGIAISEYFSVLTSWRITKNVAHKFLFTNIIVGFFLTLSTIFFEITMTEIVDKSAGILAIQFHIGLVLAILPFLFFGCVHWAVCGIAFKMLYHRLESQKTRPEYQQTGGSGIGPADSRLYEQGAGSAASPGSRQRQRTLPSTRRDTVPRRRARKEPTLDI